MPTSLSIQPKTSGRTLIEFPPVRGLFEDMESLTNKIAQRAFELFQQRGAFDGGDWSDWFQAESELLKATPIEISEADDSFILRAEVPGFDAKEINVQVEPNSIYIHGKVEHKKESEKGAEVKYSEVSAREIARRVDLPRTINPEKATAILNNGILELKLPKTAPPKTIEVKAA
jgi:HSP20 family protein